MLKVALLAFNYWMHPYVTLQRLLIFIYILALILPTFVIGNSSDENCKGDVKTVKLYVTDIGYVQIKKGHPYRVIANQDTRHVDLLQISLSSNTVLFYHPETKQFICWNMKYTNLEAKANPDIPSCEFREDVASNSHVQYSTINQTNPSKPAIMQFNRKGRYPNVCIRKMFKNKNKRRHGHKYSKEKKNDKRCGQHHILPHIQGNCKQSSENFCTDMANIKRVLPFAIQEICNKQP